MGNHQTKGLDAQALTAKSFAGQEPVLSTPLLGEVSRPMPFTGPSFALTTSSGILLSMAFCQPHRNP